MSTVTIVCNAEVHAEPYEVFRFRLKNDDETASRPVWVSGSDPKIKGWKPAAGQLLGDRYVTDEDKRADPTLIYRNDFRIRYEFVCDCGLKLVARYENLTPVLDRLAAAGVATISMTALAARICP